MSARMYVWGLVREPACIHAFLSVCVHACVRVCLCACLCVCGCGCVCLLITEPQSFDFLLLVFKCHSGLWAGGPAVDTKTTLETFVLSQRLKKKNKNEWKPLGIQIQNPGAAEPHFYMIVSDRCSQLMLYILVIIVVFCEREGITLGTWEMQLKLKHIFYVHSSLKSNLIPRFFAPC